MHIVKLLLLQFVLAQIGSSSNQYKVWTYYDGNTCDGTPYNSYTEIHQVCSSNECIEDGNTSITRVGFASSDCTSDYRTSMINSFGNSPFILVEVYNDAKCQTLSYAQGFSASGNCEGSPNLNTSEAAHVIAKLASDGSAVLKYYNDDVCASTSLNATYTTDSTALATHECDENWTKWYYIEGGSIQSSSDTNDQTSSPKSGLKSTIIIAIIAGAFLLLVLIVVLLCCRKRRSNVKETETEQQPTASLQSRDTSFMDMVRQGQSGLWNDNVITAKRIPRDKVRIKKAVSRGAYGEVCEGVFNGQKVAIKMLLPHNRGNLEHVNDLLTEAKMAATMEHPHIVAFVGVAWDSLSDVCVVFEFMEGGDLRALLNKYEQSRHPTGLDRQKTTIALHVCHALTYLHSLIPPVIHRDLKSRNILLNRSLEAKLTDFGISRERQDQTMTAGVGTSLWMAPEVMLGERYDVKADMFSFGVVLSELDLHTLPYNQARDEERDSNGRKLPDAAILQQVAMGKIQVAFSSTSPKSLIELGHVCVSLRPSDRPTAAEALYRLQVILSREMV